MVMKNGNVEMIQGSTDKKTFTIYKEDGVTPQPLPNTTDLTLWLKHTVSKENIYFNGSQVQVVDVDKGIVDFFPSATDFETNKGDNVYTYHFAFNDAASNPIKIPIDPGRYTFTVFDNCES
jgi:hypothetical protein